MSTRRYRSGRWFAAIASVLLLAAWILWANRSEGEVDYAPGPAILDAATEAALIVTVPSDAIVSLGKDGNARRYEVDLSVASSSAVVTNQGATLSGVITFERPSGTWLPIEWAARDYDTFVLLVRLYGPDFTAGTIFGLTEDGDIDVVDWDAERRSYVGQTGNEEAVTFNTVKEDADPAVALAELAKARLAERGRDTVLPTDGSDLGLRLLDALWPDRFE